MNIQEVFFNNYSWNQWHFAVSYSIPLTYLESFTNLETMKRIILLVCILWVTNAFSHSIPKKFIGQYDAEVPAFEFEDNGHTVYASAYTLSIILREDYLWYETEMFKFFGEFKNFEENKDHCNIAVDVSNDLSMNFDFDLHINKKSGDVAISGLTGVPVLELQKRAILVTRK